MRLARITQDPKEDNEKLKNIVLKVGHFGLSVLAGSFTGICIALTVRLQVIELTSCSEDQALAALHDCDNDVQQAVSAVLDGSAVRAVGCYYYFKARVRGGPRSA